ncbi:hypothetical protein C8A01DRAFT_20793 [Parachaetomium inaequale]|uniref:Stc1 domain-containing protein n=1 Tax=Parachaetomium inaequale TaxID=2588326 RepID=A0AAN6P5Q0_9PEZI|nr:hypothetical protein C8A01DRAFT_20793 [Parachaetomium inaequale]
MTAGRLRCEHGEWKTRDHFSQSQLRKYDQQARSGNATASQTGIRCTEHTGRQPLELKCNGPCNRWRDLRMFSKSTRRKGTHWCVDCTDWQIRTENGEALPPPGGQLSVEEAAPRPLPPTQAAHLQDEMVSEADVANSDSFFDDGRSDLMSDDQLSEATYSIAEDESDRLDTIIPHLLHQLPARAPHWLIPDMGGLPTGSLRSSTATADSTSVASSDMTVSARGAQGPGPAGVPFNAWGPNGEYARMVKTPTVVSGSTSTQTTRSRQPENLGRNGWAKVPGRKQAPQLPDYLKHDMPEAGDDDDDGLDLESDDGITW